MKTFPAINARIGSVTEHIVDPNVESSDQAMSRLQDVRPETAQGYIHAGEALGHFLTTAATLRIRFGAYRSAKTA